MKNSGPKRSSVKKFMASLPHPLYRFATKEARKIAKSEGRSRPNLSGYIARLIVEAKDRQPVAE